MPKPPSKVVLDPARLAALLRAALLDTPAEESFDQLTRLACTVLKVPVALVSLVDDHRQFFKSAIGLSEPLASTRETPLSHSFCQHVVTTGKQLVVEDAREVPLLRDNLAIPELGVIAYAGVPLRTGDGHVLGTLCVSDQKPRTWQPAELELLGHLAACVVAQIELGPALRGVQRDLAESARQAAAELTAILDTALDAIIRMDSSGHISGWNNQAATTFGWSPAEAIGRPLADLIIPPQHREGHRRGLEHFLATGEGPILSRRIDITALHRTGREFPVELTVTPVRVGGDWFFTAFVRDITIWVEAEKALKTATERFRLVSQATNDTVWDWDLVANTLWWNEAFESMFGFRRADVEPGPESWYSRIHPDDRTRVVDGIHAVIDGGGTAWADEYRFRRADGSHAEVFDRGHVTRDDQGRPVRMVGAMMDLTLRRRAEEAQRAVYRIAEVASTTTGLQELLHEVHAIVGELFPARNLFVALHDAAAGTLSFPYWVDENDPHPAPRPLGHGLTEYVLRTQEPLLATPEVHGRLNQQGEADFVGAPSLDWIGVPLRIEGKVIGVLAVQTYVEQVRYGEREKNILQFVSTQVARAIERLRAEEQIRESETRYRLLFESNPEAMWVYDAVSLGFLAVNEAAIRRYGYTRAEFLTMTIRDIRSPSDHTVLEQLLRQPIEGPAIHSELRHRKKDGGALEVEIQTDALDFSGRPARLVLVRDLTQRKQLEDQLRQAQKMEAVGQLAGGIAHDFNNLLTAILGSTELLIEGLRPDDPARELAHESRKAALRAAELTRQLLAFSRRQVLAPRVLLINEVVANLDKMLRRLLGEHIDLRTVLGPDLAAVRADPGQLEQVIVNLAVNSRDAMADGGKLTITTANVLVNDPEVAADTIVAPGAYVMLAVSDTGIGMDAETQARAFEPFFTTKPVGKGTGLGLATVYGIVKQSGGYIRLASAPRRGTTFSLYFPRVEASVEPSRSDAGAEASLGGAETVLLVEDQEEVRTLTHKLLKARGYQVLVAGSGPEALRLAERHPRPIHLLLTDVVMPGMNGRELSRRLAPTRPEMKILFLSGYPDESIMENGALAPGVAFLQKPFSVQGLAKKVREVLDAKGDKT